MLNDHIRLMENLEEEWYCENCEKQLCSISDHKEYLEHLKNYVRDWYNSVEIENVIESFQQKKELKTTLSVLYAFVWTWVIVGEILQCYNPQLE